MGTVRRNIHVHIRKGDQFVDTAWIRLHVVQKEIAQLQALGNNTTKRNRLIHKGELTEQQTNSLNQLKAELPKLLEHDTSANWQTAQYKQEVQSLRRNPRKLLLILDFTKFNQVSSRGSQAVLRG